MLTQRRRGLTNSRVFVLEAGGRPVCAFVASAQREARELLREDWLLGDLAKANGRVPLWDGKEKLSIRLASPLEVARYEDAQSQPQTDPGSLHLVSLGN